MGNHSGKDDSHFFEEVDGFFASYCPSLIWN